MKKNQLRHKKIKTVELVKCGKCDKELTKRTLRYDHDKTCPGEPVLREALPVKRRAPVKKVEVEKKNDIPVEMIEREMQKHLQSSAQERIQHRLRLQDEKMRKLSAQIA